MLKNLCNSSNKNTEWLFIPNCRGAVKDKLGERLRNGFK